jgi:hypothetical protein
LRSLAGSPAAGALVGPVPYILLEATCAEQCTVNHCRRRVAERRLNRRPTGVRMAEEWLTYSALAERLGGSAEAARQRAIRARWPRRTANDGRTQVLVDVEEAKAAMPPRAARDSIASDTRLTGESTPVEPSSDGRTLAALEAHIETLKAMIARADHLALGRERERADAERVRADSERARVEAERERAETLERRLEEAQARAAQRAESERQLTVLRAQLAEMQAASARPWWRRLTR